MRPKRVFAKRNPTRANGPGWLPSAVLEPIMSRGRRLGQLGDQLKGLARWYGPAQRLTSPRPSRWPPKKRPTGMAKSEPLLGVVLASVDGIINRRSSTNSDRRARSNRSSARRTSRNNGSRPRAAAARPTRRGQEGDSTRPASDDRCAEGRTVEEDEVLLGQAAEEQEVELKRLH